MVISRGRARESEGRHVIDIGRTSGPTSGASLSKESQRVTGSCKLRVLPLPCWKRHTATGHSPPDCFPEHFNEAIAAGCHAGFDPGRCVCRIPGVFLTVSFLGGEPRG